MGVCSSCEATSVATAKLILCDGRLQEFPHPVKVSYVLQKNPSCFICNSDEMDFDDVVSAVSDDDELQPGQLYFALPLSRLQRRLQAEEMAALAVKASSALTKSGEKCGHRGSVLVFAEANGGGVRRRKVSGAGDGASRRRSVVAGGGARRRSGKISARLSAIPE
ncbi:HTH-type transcriptional regulator protein ptxE [Dorcoceras hygrometricum]|uniref:HTH-type transcriptional regulator protein ptxE n=1 Tax=Dorcoceras hygrometricum TaxID=472368 RepID=A0A2Z7CYJ9_9LAMI|nr:HTH-type transcriptional regulator protein ptxE [Dorcoceras hygrometricum]